MPRNKIISVDNENIKQVAKLRDRKFRDLSGCTIVDGIKEIFMAVDSGVKINSVYICPDFCDEKKISGIFQRMKINPSLVYEVPPKVFEKISYGERLEGIVVVCQTPRVSLNQLQFKPNPCVVVVERIEKPGNLGAILRTSDAAGVEAVLVCESVSDIYNPNVIRASLGTVFSVNVVGCANDEALSFLKKNQFKTCVASPHAKALYTQEDFTGAVALVFGSEHEGLSSFWTKNADGQVRIPMLGKADSLNLSTSAAILIYETLRQRRK